MTLSAKIEPSLRRAVFTSPSFLASGDVSEDLVLEFPHRAPDAASLSLTLRREGPSGEVVAVASGFEAVERHSHMVSCALSLKTSALDAWRLDDLEAASGDAKDRPSGPYRTAWLDVFDDSSAYVSCAVPVLLRDVYSRPAASDGTVRYDCSQTLSSDDAARARANISAASAAEAAAAKSAADAAGAAGAAAKAVADGAAQTASRALSQSTDAKADASAAKTTADAAQAAADGAKTLADRASSSAETALTTAKSALTTASDAVDAAALAGSKADAAKSAAESAQSSVDALKSTVPVLEDGVVPAQYLPSYVDDVLEAASKSGFPASGESGKIYVALDTNLAYRWGGSSYVEISPSLALGETASTAYAGDKGLAVANDVASLKAGKADKTDLAAASAAASDAKTTAEGAVSAAAAAKIAVDAHVADTANPHGVSAAQVGCLTEAQSDGRYFPLSRESELAKASDLSGYLPTTGGTLESGLQDTILRLGDSARGYGQVELRCDKSAGGSIVLMDVDGTAKVVIDTDDAVVNDIRLSAVAAAAEGAKTTAEAAAAAAEGAVSSAAENAVGEAFALSRTYDGATATLKFDLGPSGLTVVPSGLYVDGVPLVSGLAIVGGGGDGDGPILDSLVLYGLDGSTALSEVKALIAPVQAAVDALSAKVDAANAALEEVA